MAVCRFANGGDDWHVLVGVAKDLILNPRSVAGGFVYTYKLINSGEKLEFLHKVRISSTSGLEREESGKMNMDGACQEVAKMY